jgi:hypothetical protein
MIQDIEQLCPELDVDFHVVDIVIFEDYQIEITHAGSDGDVSTAISQTRARLRRRETLRFDVVGRVSAIYGIVATGQVQAVGKVECAGVIHS